MLSIAIVSLWALANFVISDNYIDPLLVSFQAVIAAVVTGIISVLVMTLRNTKYESWLTALVVTSLSIMLLLSIASTGNLASPYLPLWVLAALFGAVAGMASFIPVGVSAISYGAYLWFYHVIVVSDWVVFALTIAFPTIIGLFIWLRRFQVQDHSDQAVSELATELDQEASKSSIIINAIADGVVLINANGIIQLINPAAQRIIGWGNEDATKLDYRSVLKIINSKDEIVDGQLDPVQRCLSTGENVITEKFGLRTVSGKQLLSSIMTSPLSGPGSGVIVVFRDITAQRAEEKGQADFISTASHEMRTPVAAIEGYLGLALNPQTATIDEKARSYLIKAQQAATHLGRLFQDLLDISKLEDGRFESNIVVVNLPEYTRNILEDFVGQAREKGLTLLYAPDNNSGSGQTVTPIFYAHADRDHLHEVLSNLITNAIKYTKAGTITVDVTADDAHVYVSVKDSGIGIPVEDVPHLFQKFYRVDNSDTREIGGTGLGLYLAQRLTEDMGGHLSVNSTYGEGSTFTVDLPRVSKELAEQSTTPQAAQDMTTQTKL